MADEDASLSMAESMLPLPLHLLHGDEEQQPIAAPSQNSSGQVHAAEAHMMDRLRQILVGPNRNIFDDNMLKQELIKPVEVLNRAHTGKFNAKQLVNNSDKERITQIKKQMMQRKALITAWLLKRESLLSRFTDTRIHKFVFAKFVLKKANHFNPLAADVCDAFAKLTQLHKQGPHMVVAHFVNIQLAIAEGMPEFLSTRRAYVEKMERLSARAAVAEGPNQAPPPSIAEAITIKRLAYNVLLDCLAAHFQDFKFDVVIDHDDQMSHYDIQRLNRRLGEAQDGEGGVANVARQQLDGILNIVGQNGGNREALLVDIFNGEPDEWDANSFVRDLIRAAAQNEPGEVGAIATENDASAILMHYMCDPKEYDPNKTSNIIQARINKQWYRRIQAAKNGDQNSIQLLSKLRPPPGLMSYRQAMTEITKHYEDNEKFATEAAESGITEGVMPFPVIIEYAMLHEHLQQLEASGQANSNEYHETLAALNRVCPPEEQHNMEPYLEQYRLTRQNFEETGVGHEQFANPSMLEAGSAVHCFPDNCQDSQDAALVSQHIVAYLDLVDSLHRTEEAIKSGASITTASAEELTQKVVEMVQGPSIEELHQNDASYFDKHYDAPWVSQVEDNLKTSLYRLAQKQAELIREQQEHDIAKTWEALEQAGVQIPEQDLPAWRSKIELAFQKPPEDYIVEGHTQTLGADGRTQKISIKYISPDVKNNIKAAKVNEKTPIKWNIVAGALWKVVCECADASEQSLDERGSWQNDLELNRDNLLAAVCQVLRPHYWQRFMIILFTDIKTSLAAEERAATMPKVAKKRKRAVLVLDDENEDGEGNASEPLQEVAKKGTLVVSSGGTQKKKPTFFAP